MKDIRTPALGLSLALAVYLIAPAPAARADAAPPPAAALSTLDQLTGPIALYPDPLLALVLPASTLPSDIAAASTYLNGGGDPTKIDVQPWDQSVRGLAHYPTVLNWMAENPDWTAAIGAAFVNNPNDVMASIQRLREMAKAAGTLDNTAQQDVVEDDGSIEIVPTDPDTIYVPAYDPAVCFVGGPYYGYHGPFITFGIGYPVGAWLAYQFDWRGRAFWHGDWRNWRNDHGWGHPVFPGRPGFVGNGPVHRWAPSPAAVRFGEPRFDQGRAVAPRSTPGYLHPPEPVHAQRSPWANPRAIPAPTGPAPRVGREAPGQYGQAPAIQHYQSAGPQHYQAQPSEHFQAMPGQHYQPQGQPHYAPPAGGYQPRSTPAVHSKPAPSAPKAVPQNQPYRKNPQ